MTRSAILCGWIALAMTAGGADRALLGIAGDAEMLIGVKARAAIESGLGRTALEGVSFPDARLDRIFQAAGLDLKRDVEEIVIAANHGSHRDALVSLRGTFDAARLRRAAVAGGLTSQAYNGIDLFTGPALEGEDHSFAVAGTTLALLGPKVRVHEAIDRWKQSATPSGALLERVREVEGGDLWLVSRAPIASLASVAPDRNTAAAARGDLFRTIEQWGVSLRLGPMVRIEGHAVARSPTDASSITEAMTFLMGLLQMQGGAGAGLAGAVEDFQASSTGNKVTVSFQIPEVTLKSALAHSLPRLSDKERRISR
ncbi:MAG: hypothetical protein ACKV22_13410 [Bryobacteraceae bacterium]